MKLFELIPKEEILNLHEITENSDVCGVCCDTRVIKEGEANLIEVNLSVPSEEEAEMMCNNWRNASQDIYANIVKLLMQE